MKETDHIPSSPLIHNKSLIINNTNILLSNTHLPTTDFFHPNKIISDYDTKKDKYPSLSGEHSSCSLSSKYRPIMNRLIMKNKSSLSIATMHN